jgi:predicted Holliday junction resolvase-like endonuclease
MKDYEILLICIAAICIALFVIPIIFSKPIKPIQILKIDKNAQTLVREQIRRGKEDECKEKEKKKLEEAKEEQEKNKKAEQLLEEANKRALAEAALLEGKDVCMNCYTIEPKRCYCGHCACYGYCYLCDD